MRGYTRPGATFEAVVRAYLERHGRRKKRSWREDARILQRDVLPRWRSRPARAITAREVRALLDAIVDRGAPIQANRTLAVIRRVFSWAAAPDRALVPQAHNPCRGLERPAPERQRDRVLHAQELRAVWRALGAEPLNNAALFKLYLLTAQRGGELRTMAWRDVDLDAGWWTIPAERAKNGRTHRVPPFAAGRRAASRAPCGEFRRLAVGLPHLSWKRERLPPAHLQDGQSHPAGERPLVRGLNIRSGAATTAGGAIPLITPARRPAAPRRSW
jgi:integrase